MENTRHYFGKANPVTFEQRQLLRFWKYESLEHSIAQHLENLKYVRLFDEELNLDFSQYPYPFGDAGMVKLTYCEWTLSGEAAWEAARKSVPNIKDSLITSHRPSVSGHRDRILFTRKAAINMVKRGRRDLLVVLNSETPSPVDTSRLIGLTELDSLKQLGG